MTKIKTSALISGMSGKMNGTVFASNAGGLYMRNNTSKVKPKTSSNSIVKGNFSSVSQAWREITDEQKQSWRDASINFPQINVFGDTYFLSGYQLFVKMNTTRSTSGLPINLTAPMPPSFPPIGDVEVQLSDLFQFIPKMAITNYVKGSYTPVQKINATGYNDGAPILNEQYIGLRVDTSKVAQGGLTSEDKLSIFTLNSNTAQQFGAYLIKESNGDYSVYLHFIGTGGQWRITSTSAPVKGGSIFHIGVVLGSASINDIKLYIDGELISCVRTPTGTPAIPSVTDGFWFGNYDLTKTIALSFSDWREYSDPVSDADALLIAKGYVLGTETAINPLYNFTVSNASDPVIGDETFIVSLIPNVVVSLTGLPFAPALIPVMNLYLPQEGQTGAKINVYASPPISRGKSGNTSNWRLITTLDWNESGLYDISAAWGEKFAYFPISANINFELQIWDEESGAMGPWKPKPSKKPIRFKAGAELSGAVN